MRVHTHTFKTTTQSHAHKSCTNTHTHPYTQSYIQANNHTHKQTHILTHKDMHTQSCMNNNICRQLIHTNTCAYTHILLRLTHKDMHTQSCMNTHTHIHTIILTSTFFSSMPAYIQVFFLLLFLWQKVCSPSKLFH